MARAANNTVFDIGGGAVATCEEIKKAAKFIYFCNLRDRLDLSPPVRLVRKDTGEEVGAWLINDEQGAVALMGSRDWHSVEQFDIAVQQGQKPSELISEKFWVELEKLLNNVANEREQDSDGPGSGPTPNARDARDMLDKLWLTRHKPVHIR